MTRAPSEPMPRPYAECGACGHWRQLHLDGGCCACGCVVFAGDHLITPVRIRLSARVLVELLAILALDAMLLLTGGPLCSIVVATGLGLYLVSVPNWRRRSRR